VLIGRSFGQRGGAHAWVDTRAARVDDLDRQVVAGDDRPPRHRDGSFDCVLELAHVAGPPVKAPRS